MRIVIAILFTATLVARAQLPFSLQDRAFIESTSPLRTSLVGCWRLEEASGTRYDRSSFGNNLTSNNSVGQTNGVSAYTGNCASFVRASNQFLQIGDTASLSFTGPFTVSCWAQFASTNNIIAVCGKGTDATHREWAIYYDTTVDTDPANRIRFKTYQSGGSQHGLVSSTNGVVLNTWYFIVGEFTGTQVKLSINNGTFVVNGISGTIGDTTGEFAIGEFDQTFRFDGLIDEVQMWKRALTTTEVAQLYNNGLGTHFPWAHP